MAHHKFSDRYTNSSSHEPGGALFAWSLTNELSFPFNHYFIFIILASSAALSVLLSMKLDRNRVDGARQSTGEAKGLLKDWQEKKQQQAASTYATTEHTPCSMKDEDGEQPSISTSSVELNHLRSSRTHEDDEVR